MAGVPARAGVGAGVPLHRPVVQFHLAGDLPQGQTVPMKATHPLEQLLPPALDRRGRLGGPRRGQWRSGQWRGRLRHEGPDGGGSLLQGPLHSFPEIGQQVEAVGHLDSVRGRRGRRL